MKVKLGSIIVGDSQCPDTVVSTMEVTVFSAFPAVPVSEASESLSEADVDSDGEEVAVEPDSSAELEPVFAEEVLVACSLPAMVSEVEESGPDEVVFASVVVLVASLDVLVGSELEVASLVGSESALVGSELSLVDSLVVVGASVEVEVGSSDSVEVTESVDDDSGSDVVSDGICGGGAVELLSSEVDVLVSM